MGSVSRPKILIVEDNSDVRRLYAIGLNQRGFEVKLAGPSRLFDIAEGELLGRDFILSVTFD